MKLCIFTGINIGGAVGWSLGETVGTMTALLASGVGGVLGVYFGWLVARKYLNVAVRSKQDNAFAAHPERSEGCAANACASLCGRLSLEKPTSS
jgi:hypothetical protein